MYCLVVGACLTCSCNLRTLLSSRSLGANQVLLQQLARSSHFLWLPYLDHVLCNLFVSSGIKTQFERCFVLSIEASNEFKCCLVDNNYDASLFIDLLTSQRSSFFCPWLATPLLIKRNYILISALFAYRKCIIIN